MSRVRISDGAIGSIPRKALFYKAFRGIFFYFGAPPPGAKKARKRRFLRRRTEPAQEPARGGMSCESEGEARCRRGFGGTGAGGRGGRCVGEGNRRRRSGSAAPGTGWRGGGFGADAGEREKSGGRVRCGEDAGEREKRRRGWKNDAKNSVISESKAVILSGCLCQFYGIAKKRVVRG